ncbi:hypothetical protein ABIB40_002539 [Pedobacter sp. UYP30]|uniref:hypothetical protein n=1 Tax=Pedobacter sp. UYP30 TaxID=1756400 RepID=UPI0033923094
MKITVLMLLLAATLGLKAQPRLNLKNFNSSTGVSAKVNGNYLELTWPVGNKEFGKMLLDTRNNYPLFKSIQMGPKNKAVEIAKNLSPAFILSIGKRTLDPKSGGWDVFFDRVPTKPHQSYRVILEKQNAATIKTIGQHTVISLGALKAANFKGHLEITLYNGSPLFNIAGVVATQADSTAILYDAGLVSKTQPWSNIAWSDVNKQMQEVKAVQADESKNLKVKYRTVIGQTANGSLAVFPAPHQYFYPLDEAFNLNFTWYGSNYRNMIPEFGIGIRQELEGDKRFVPWFNAPPKTQQRLNFFCLLSKDNPEHALQAVKKFTHDDKYVSLPGYKTMQSHFHNEFISKVVLAGKPIPEEPNFVKVFKELGVNIVHLAEFHGEGHPKGPDSLRLMELDALFKQCNRLSGKNFLLLPGEEANNFYGGHWLAFFPKPVYWVMSKGKNVPFVTTDPQRGKVYHVGNKEEMLKLLEVENGLAWTAHARTKGSTGYPDAYKDEKFFRSNTFLGAAWKNIPADLSIETLSKRVLNLMDDMNNWGLKKKIIAECDLFTIEPENEMYAHLNVNYLKMDKIPDFSGGWQPVLDVMKKGNFFSTTGEVLIPKFTVNGKSSGETIRLEPSKLAKISFDVNWTFPLNYAELVSGDGERVYRNRIDLSNTKAFESKTIKQEINLKGRKWVRLEVWDIATNGAFTQTIWLE